MRSALRSEVVRKICAAAAICCSLLDAKRARATIEAFVVDTPTGTGTGFLMNGPPGHSGLYLVTALHVLRGAKCAIATPHLACSTDIGRATLNGTKYENLTSCPVKLANSAPDTLDLSNRAMLIWMEHDLVAIEAGDVRLASDFSAGNFQAVSALPNTTRTVALQGSARMDVCPNGDGRLRYYVPAGPLADWAAGRSHGVYHPQDFIGTLSRDRMLLVMGSTGAAGTSGGPVTESIDDDNLIAMYQGGDGVGQSTWGVVVTRESLSSEQPLARKFGDWSGIPTRTANFNQVDEDLEKAVGQVLSARVQQPPIAWDLPFVIAEGAPVANESYDVGGGIGVGGFLFPVGSGSLDIRLAVQYTRRFTTVSFHTPKGVRDQVLGEHAGSGGSLGLEGGLRLRFAQKHRGWSTDFDLTLRGRVIAESGRDEGTGDNSQGAWGPIVRARTCGALSWSWNVCLGAGLAVEQYRAANYSFDGFGGVTQAPRAFWLRPQLVAGFEYAP